MINFNLFSTIKAAKSIGDALNLNNKSPKMPSSFQKSGQIDEVSSNSRIQVTKAASESLCNSSSPTAFSSLSSSASLSATTSPSKQASLVNKPDQEIMLDNENDNSNDDERSSPDTRELTIKREINKNAMLDSPSSAKKPRLSTDPRQQHQQQQSSSPSSTSTSPVNDFGDRTKSASTNKNSLEQNAVPRVNRHGSLNSLIETELMSTNSHPDLLKHRKPSLTMKLLQGSGSSADGEQLYSEANETHLNTNNKRYLDSSIKRLDRSSTPNDGQQNSSPSSVQSNGHPFTLPSGYGMLLLIFF